jgi:hypothetical protein
VLESFDEAAKHKSGVHDQQTDLAWFRAEFGDPHKLPPPQKPARGAAVKDTPFEERAKCLSFFSAGDYANSAESFKNLAKKRGKLKAFDWLYVAMSNAHLGQYDEALLWYEKSVKDIEESKDPPAELLELRDSAKRLLDEKREDRNADMK